MDFGDFLKDKSVEGFQDMWKRIQRERSGSSPPVKVCETKKELGEWFASFGRACAGARGPK
jgi:hypothetical protein